MRNNNDRSVDGKTDKRLLRDDKYCLFFVIGAIIKARPNRFDMITIVTSCPIRKNVAV